MCVCLGNESADCRESCQLAARLAAEYSHMRDLGKSTMTLRRLHIHQHDAERQCTDEKEEMGK